MNGIKLFTIITITIIFGMPFTCSSQNAQMNIPVVVAADDGIPVPIVTLKSVYDISSIPSLQVNSLVFNINTMIADGSGLGFYFYNGNQWVYLLSTASKTQQDNVSLQKSGPSSSPNILTHFSKISTVNLSTSFHTHTSASTDLAMCRCVR